MPAQALSQPIPRPRVQLKVRRVLMMADAGPVMPRFAGEKEAALETSKSTLMIGIQVSRGANREELVAGLKMSMQETMTNMFGYEFGSKRIQDVRAHLDSVSMSLQERQPNAGAAAPATEVNIESEVTTSVFEDIISFHDRVQAAVAQQLEGVLSEEHRSDGPARIGLFMIRRRRGATLTIPSSFLSQWVPQYGANVKNGENGTLE
ncbi:hypothetical protein F5144DRAFT_643582 [Chaetomium tenue]|uniref:Uncharacterized protein n=1 Tax=Chaetomium tenue TaxID=1854479 RepID=A0ACB7PMA6_9PEZI|nr:hypothetical protein F5144DRAFT_643582 [Chaetomium globosum]